MVVHCEVKFTADLYSSSKFTNWNTGMADSTFHPSKVGRASTFKLCDSNICYLEHFETASVQYESLY